MSDARSTLLDTAADLFYREGVGVGIDTIVAESGVAKTTLYRHFTSKDELIAEYLRGRGVPVREMLERVRTKAAGDPRAEILGIFAYLERWFKRDDFQGCAFANAGVQLAHLPDHPAHAIVVAHKDEIQEHFRAACQRIDAPSASERADAIMLIYEGAMTTALLRREDRPAHTAARLVRKLLT